MNFPIDNPLQAKAVLRSLRRARGLTQAEVGGLIGVGQKRIARIEGYPHRTSLEQIARLVAVLGGRITIEERGSTTSGKAPATEKVTW